MLLAGLSITGCQEKDAPLPEDTYPLTFTGTIEQLATRSSISGVWDGSERIAVLSMSGSDAGVVKNYATDSNGLMNSPDPFFWKKENESKDISAWYCGDGSTAVGQSNSTSVSSWTVRQDQTGDGYAQSDFLYATGTCEYNGNNSLAFHHQISRIVVNIMGDGALKDPAEIASVKIGERNIALSASFTAPAKGSQTGEWTLGESDSDIVPNAVSAQKGCLASYEALLIPQNMDGRTFIAVTLSNGDVLTYEPSEGEASLLAGYQYTYNVQVGDLKLDVTVEVGVAWGEGETIDIDSEIR